MSTISYCKCHSERHSINSSILSMLDTATDLWKNLKSNALLVDYRLTFQTKLGALRIAVNARGQFSSYTAASARAGGDAQWRNVPLHRDFRVDF